MTEAETAEALGASERALALEPYIPEAHVARACVLSMQGRNDQAARGFEEAIRLNPSAHMTYHLYGRHAFGVGDMEKAVELFRTAMSFSVYPITLAMARGIGARRRIAYWRRCCALSFPVSPACRRRQRRRVQRR